MSQTESSGDQSRSLNGVHDPQVQQNRTKYSQETMMTSVSRTKNGGRKGK